MYIEFKNLQFQDSFLTIDGSLLYAKSLIANSPFLGETDGGNLA